MTSRRSIRQLARRQRRGNALVFALIAVSVLAIMGGAALTLSASTSRTVNHARQDLRSFYLAEAGLSEALAAVAVAAANDEDLPKTLGTHDAPRVINGGSYWVTIEEDEDDDTVVVTSVSEVNGARHGLEAVLVGIGDPVYSHALFAGNSSGDPTYTLKLGGSGTQADQISGDLFSGGDVTVTGTAAVDGEIRASGSIYGADGDDDVKQPIPDLAAMDYASICNVDVKTTFDKSAAYKSDSLGGSAWQVDESDPAHIFRKNPSDRLTNTLTTSKDDYFLEDPYEPVRSDSAMDGTDACPITLSGTAGDPGSSGSNLIYYIDGNLWLHNSNTFSFKLTHAKDESAVVTFVVQGNIYFSDNLFYQDAENDAVVFIALEDPKVADSGNIYFGDPVFGTLEEMHAFMYAENDFHDVNLDASGSANVRVYGNMSAGNHVAIQRDYKSGKKIYHSQLVVDFDDRIANKEIVPPGLPVVSGATEGYMVVSWREVAAH